MGNHAVDFTGQRFGKLTAIHVVRKPEKSKRIFWLCRCDCGNETFVSSGNLRSGGVKSCGCLRLYHGLMRRGQRHPLTWRWHQMMARCYNPNCDRYRFYGGRGIAVCERWQTFINFYNDMVSTFSCELTLERKDNNGPYSPDNCIWVDWTTQANNKRNNHYLNFNGETLSVTQWANRVGLWHGTLFKRLKAGKTINQVLSSEDGRKTRWSKSEHTAQR